MQVTISIACGRAKVKHSLAQELHKHDVVCEEEGGCCLLVDEPLGWATLEHPAIPMARSVIATNNACPTYQLDLLERSPAALVLCTEADALATVVRAVVAGKTLRPTIVTPLTPVERLTVRLVAKGCTNKKIAQRRRVSEGTVKNTLTSVYKKLNLESRVHLAHYYFSSWHLLEGWSPPPHVLHTRD